MAITLSGTTITMNDASTIVSTTTHLAIGSYATLSLGVNQSSVAVGATVAGTSLRYNVGNVLSGSSLNGPVSTSAGAAASGTWRNMAGQVNNSGTSTMEGFVHSAFPCLSARVS